MKMQFKPSDINNLRSKDIVKISTIFEKDRTYLIVKVGRSDKYIRAIPLDKYMGSPDRPEAIPAIDIPSYMICEYEKLDKSLLLFMANQSNPHILEALAALGME